MVEPRVTELPLFGTSIDKSQVPPIHQKRIVAFVNTFILQTAEFLNNFAGKCESHLLSLEIKLNRVDTQLQLIEAKLNSIPDVQKTSTPPKPVEEPKAVEAESVIEKAAEAAVVPVESSEVSVVENPAQGVKAKDDYRYRKYFKMLTYGVPLAGVKQKLQAEGMDPDILDDPDRILPDGDLTGPPVPEEDSDDSD